MKVEHATICVHKIARRSNQKTQTPPPLTLTLNLCQINKRLVKAAVHGKCKQHSVESGYNATGINIATGYNINKKVTTSTKVVHVGPFQVLL